MLEGVLRVIEGCSLGVRGVLWVLEGCSPGVRGVLSGCQRVISGC